MSDEGKIKMITKEEISRILTNSDPQSLIKMGAPSDEYSHEADLIINRINENYNLSKEDIHNIVYYAFYVMFEKRYVGKKETYANIAEEIYNIIQKNKTEQSFT